MPAPRKAELGPITQRAEAGRAAFYKLFTAWSAQASQPTWLALGEAACGEKVLHSSQVKGFQTGVLQFPAPTVFVALGTLNLAIAQGTLPDRLRAKWQPLQPLLINGQVATPELLFLAFTGLIEIDLPPEQPTAEDLARLGSWLRRHCGANGIDFAVDDRARLEAAAPCLAKLLRGRPATWAEVEPELPAIAQAVGCLLTPLREVLGLGG